MMGVSAHHPSKPLKVYLSTLFVGGAGVLGRVTSGALPVWEPESTLFKRAGLGLGEPRIRYRTGPGACQRDHMQEEFDHDKGA